MFALNSWAELALVEAEVLVGVPSVGILIYLTLPEWPVKELLCEQVQVKDMWPVCHNPDLPPVLNHFLQQVCKWIVIHI